MYFEINQLADPYILSKASSTRI